MRASRLAARYLSLVALILLPAVVSQNVRTARAVGPTAPNQMGFDADGETPLVQNTRTAQFGSDFSVAIWITANAGANGYQWEIEFPSAGLEYVAGSAVENPATGWSICAAPVQGSGIVDPANDTTVGLGAGCVGAASTTYNGMTTTIRMKCKSLGSFSVLLLDTSNDENFGTSLLDLQGSIDTGTTGGTINCSAADVNDTDGDGCSNVEELGTDPRLGGDRNPLDANDFFDVPVPALTATNSSGTRNKLISNADVLAVTYYVGASENGPPNANGVSYDSDLNHNGVKDGAEYDRTPSVIPGEPWRTGPPNGAVTNEDVDLVRQQVGDTCTAPP